MTKGIVRELSGEDTEDEDFEDDEEDPEAMFNMFVESGTPWHKAQNVVVDAPPIETSNRFQNFTDYSNSDGSDLNAALGNFAHRVNTGPRMSQSQRNK